MVAERGGRCVIRHPRVATPRVSIFYRCIARRALHNENGLSPKRNLRGFGFPPRAARHLTLARACSSARECHMAHCAVQFRSLPSFPPRQDHSHYAERAAQRAM